MRHSWLILALCLVIPFGFSTLGVAEDGISSGVKRPLDLPAGGPGEKSEEEEDAPESIVFYGGEFEGDQFVWTFPAYGFCGDTTVFAAIKAEITNALGQLSNQAKFDLIGFNSTTYVWSPAVVPASPGNKGSAIAWMNTMTPIEAHCITDATVTALGISQAGDSEHKQMVVCGAREPYCNGVGNSSDSLIQITGANYENTPLHTIYFSTSFYSGYEAFYQQLSAMNGGTFRQVAF